MFENRLQREVTLRKWTYRELVKIYVIAITVKLSVPVLN
jgi:hypothetical protein